MNDVVVLYLYGRTPRKSKAELAEALGISKPTLNKRMANPEKWTIKDVVTMSQLTGTPISEFLA